MAAKQLTTKRAVPFPLYDIDILSASRSQLDELSKSMGLNLSPEEMDRVVKYYTDLGRSPTDVELQSIGQAWSEHCCYKSSKVFLRRIYFGH